MPIFLHNTLSRRKEGFQPRDLGRVSMYVCGQTPQGPAHLGHARKAVAFDVIRRHFEFRGFAVTLVENITDVEDKIIARAKAEGVSWQEIADRYATSYLAEMAELNVLPAAGYPRASEHIADMIGLIERLIAAGHAYPAEGDVYYRVRRFESYGKLSGRRPDDMRAGARVEVSEQKEDPLDFALWKAAKPGEPSWDSPWGPGRPGWHIECSVMCERYLGLGFDIHGGGADLIFPHHENEIAQSEALAEGQPFARYWLHNGWVTFNAEKMSKSIGNVVNVREAIDRVGAQTVRYYLLAPHYRSDLEYSDEGLAEAGRSLERLRIGVGHLNRLLELEPAAGAGALDLDPGAAREEFLAAMDDEFNTPPAVAALHQLVGDVHRATGASDYRPAAADRETLPAAREVLVELGGRLGLDLQPPGVRPKDGGLTEQLLALLVDLRQMARERRQFEIADAVRSRLADLGIILEDHPEGTTWRRREGGSK